MPKEQRSGAMGAWHQPTNRWPGGPAALLPPAPHLELLLVEQAVKARPPLLLLGLLLLLLLLLLLALLLPLAAALLLLGGRCRRRLVPACRVRRLARPRLLLLLLLKLAAALHLLGALQLLAGLRGVLPAATGLLGGRLLQLQHLLHGTGEPILAATLFALLLCAARQALQRGGGEGPSCVASGWRRRHGTWQLQLLRPPCSCARRPHLSLEQRRLLLVALAAPCGLPTPHLHAAAAQAGVGHTVHSAGSGGGGRGGEVPPSCCSACMQAGALHAASVAHGKLPGGAQAR